jgi:hypothetical protein
MSNPRSRLSALMVGLTVLALGGAFGDRLLAKEEKPPTGRITVSTNSDDEKLTNSPVMVSVIRDGTILQQSEVRIGTSTTFSDLLLGSYEVRIEGDGCKTLVKRGLQVTNNNNTYILGGPLEKGKGVHIVEYATGGLSREELADRLAKIEAMLAKLDARLSADAKGPK